MPSNIQVESFPPSLSPHPAFLFSVTHPCLINLCFMDIPHMLDWLHPRLNGCLFLLYFPLSSTGHDNLSLPIFKCTIFSSMYVCTLYVCDCETVLVVRLSFYGVFFVFVPSSCLSAFEVKVGEKQVCSGVCLFYWCPWRIMMGCLTPPVKWSFL